MERNSAQSSLPEYVISSTRAAVIGVAPVVLLAAFLYHPHIVFLPSAEAVAHAVQADTVRWAIAHWGVGIGSALMGVAFAALCGHLRDAGENRWSALASPFLIFAAAVYAILPGMEFTVLAAAKTGGNIVASQEAVDTWFVPTLLIAGITNAAGVFFLTRAIRASRILGDSARAVVVSALVVLAVARLVPIGPIHFYVQGLAGVIALWPISGFIRKSVAVPQNARARAMTAGL
jgi:hypothetical protein